MERLGAPSAAFCFGRDGLCREVVNAALENGAALLFGGRQAGKTTILLRIQESWRPSAEKLSASPLIVPILVNLMKLPPEDGVHGIYKMMIVEAINACRAIVSETICMEQAATVGSQLTLDHLIRHLGLLIKAIQRSDVYILFLFDETKRILGKSYSRGVQDNLFSLLWGEHELAGRVAIIFAGAQELFEFSVDETSPIGSRAAVQILENLPPEAIREMAARVVKEAEQTQTACANDTFLLTGGQPGLSLRVLARCLDMRALSEIDKEQFLRKRTISLFQVWVSGLSPEARTLQEKLVGGRTFPTEEAGHILHDAGFDRYMAERACDELVFTGIARRTQDGLALANKLYASFLQNHGWNELGSPAQQEAWAEIERVELTLRAVVRKAYSERWGTHADAQIESVLGADSWKVLQENKAKSARSYRYSSHPTLNDILHFAYFGQLTQLMLSRQAWDMFKTKFRDKRELEDIVKDVTPVRNDRAHFRTVPARELQRCVLRCGDLSHLIG